MNEQHIIKDRIKPPLQSYRPSSDIPKLPEIEPEAAAAALLKKDWSSRVIRNRHIKCLRQIITPLLEVDSLPQDFDQVVFQRVVIEEGDLTELVIPFKLCFQEVFFLDGLHLNHSHFAHLDLSGYIGYALSLRETKGQPIINLVNLEADQVYVDGGAGLDCFGVSYSTIGTLTIASTTVKRHVTMHDDVAIPDGLWLENLTVGQGLSLLRCTIHKYFRLHNVSCTGNMELEACDLSAPLSTRSSSCTKLSLSESQCSGRLDFRSLSFQEIDVSNTGVTGQLFLNLSQLQRRKDSKPFTARQTRKWDIPPCLSPQRSSTLRESVSIAEQLIVLRENFRRIAITGQEEQYCSYQLADATWEFQPLAKFTHCIAKQGFGYLLLPLRIVRTMAVLVVLFAFLYVVFAGLRVGNLVFSDGRPILQDGLFWGVGRSLYFSLVTFSTSGFGDIHPVGILPKLFAAIETFTGPIVVALFTVSLARRLFRW